MTFTIPFLDFGGEGTVFHFAHPNAYPPGCFHRFLRPFTEAYHVLATCHRPLWPDSDPDELTDWQLVTDDLIHFLDQRKLQRVVGVGHSLGAVTTLYAAVKRPDLFSRLILIEPVLLSPQILQMVAEYPEQAHLRPMVQQALKRRNHWQSREAAFNRFRSKKVFERFADDALWDYVNNATAEAENGEFYLVFPREWEARFYALPPQHVWEALPQVRQPTLGIRAQHSDALFPDAWQLWQAVQPEATFVEMADVGHMLTMEQPERVAHLIQAWLAGEINPAQP